MEIKSPNNSNLPNVISFLNKHLRSKVDWSVNNEYPVAVSNYNLNNIKFIEDAGSIVSHALLKYLMIKTPVGLFKVAIVGSVVTDKDHQKKGLANKLITELLAKAQKDNCDICLLWSDLDTFYNKLGFELAGSEEHLSIQKPNGQLTINNELRFSDAKNIDPKLILKLFSEHQIGSVRSEKEIASYLKIPNSKVFTLWNDKNNLLAYAIKGRGMDLPNVIHEWGGNVPNLLQLFSHISHSKEVNDFQLITSSTATNLINKIKDNFVCSHDSRTLGYIKILNMQNIHYKILRWARLQGEHHFQTFSQNNKIYLRYKSKNYQLPNNNALTRLVWGPITQDLIEHLDPDLQRALLAVFPLPIWVWGWDIA